MARNFPSRVCSGTRCHAAPCAVSLIVALCILAVPAGAHSPAGMSIAWNEASGELAVTITHQVADPATHYIREVTISVDGQAVKTTPYTGQPSAPSFTYFYPLQARAGSSVKVDASCNLGGSVTRTIVVPGSTGATPVVPGSGMSAPVVQGSAGPAPVAPDLQAPATKAAAGMAPVLGVVLLLIWRRSG